MPIDLSKQTDIEIYDRAVVKYLSEVNNKVVYSPTDLAEYTITKKYNVPEDLVPYPFISVYRDPNIPIDWSRYSSHTIGADFVRLSSTSDGKRTARYVHSIPVTLSYQVEIWGVKSTEVLALSQELLLKLTIKNPVLFAPINPEGENGRFYIEDVNLVDNSDIESEEDRGRLYRHTFTFSIDARIKYVRDVDTTKFEEPEVHPNDEDDIYNF